jgi:hypothetical protein
MIRGAANFILGTGQDATDAAERLKVFCFSFGRASRVEGKMTSSGDDPAGRRMLCGSGSCLNYMKLDDVGIPKKGSMLDGEVSNCIFRR